MDVEEEGEEEEGWRRRWRSRSRRSRSIGLPDTVSSRDDPGWCDDGTSTEMTKESLKRNLKERNKGRVMELGVSCP